MVSIDPLAFAIVAVGFFIAGAVLGFNFILTTMDAAGYHRPQLLCVNCGQRVKIRLAGTRLFPLWVHELTLPFSVCDNEVCIAASIHFTLVDLRVPGLRSAGTFDLSAVGDGGAAVDAREDVPNGEGCPWCGHPYALDENNVLFCCNGSCPKNDDADSPGGEHN